MTHQTAQVSVRILDKEYQVSCPAEEVDALTTSARYLDEQMRTIRESGKIFGLDRIAVMAALNIASDYLQVRQSEERFSVDVASRVKDLKEKLEQNMADGGS